MKSIYSEDYKLLDKDIERLGISIELLIKNKYIDGYNLTEVESELIAVISATVSELKLKHGLRVRREHRSND